MSVPLPASDLSSIDPVRNPCGPSHGGHPCPDPPRSTAPSPPRPAARPFSTFLERHTEQPSGLEGLITWTEQRATAVLGERNRVLLVMEGHGPDAVYRAHFRSAQDGVRGLRSIVSHPGRPFTVGNDPGAPMPIDTGPIRVLVPLCAACQGTAGISAIVPPMLTLPEQLDHWPPSEHPRFIVAFGAERWMHITDLLDQARQHITDKRPRDLFMLEPTFAPWWCAACDTAYCARHMCPLGHRKG